MAHSNSNQGDAMCVESTALVVADLAGKSTRGVLTVADQQVDKINDCIGSMEQILRCDCGKDCIMRQPATSKKRGAPGSAMAAHPDALPPHNLVLDDRPPVVVCAGLHHFDDVLEPVAAAASGARAKSARVAQKRIQGQGEKPRTAADAANKAKREARLGLRQGGCIVCAACYDYKRYLCDGECRGCLIRKAALPPHVANTAETLWLEHPAELPGVTALGKQIKAIKVANDGTRLCLTNAMGRGEELADYADGEPGNAQEQLAITDASDGEAVASPAAAGLGAEARDHLGVSAADGPAPASDDEDASEWADNAKVREKQAKSLKSILADILGQHSGLTRALAETQTAHDNCTRNLDEEKKIEDNDERIGVTEKALATAEAELKTATASLQHVQTNRDGRISDYHDLCREKHDDTLFRDLTEAEKEKVLGDFIEANQAEVEAVSYTHLRAHETR